MCLCVSQAANFFMDSFCFCLATPVARREAGSGRRGVCCVCASSSARWMMMGLCVCASNCMMKKLVAWVESTGVQQLL